MAYIPTRWGRTNQPKAPNNQNGNTVTGAASVSVLNDLNTSQFSASAGCYQTENQRYAHIMCSGSSTVSAVYLYTYAANQWHELKTVNPTDGSRHAVAVAANEHISVDINGADWISLTSGSLSNVTLAFSTF